MKFTHGQLPAVTVFVAVIGIGVTVTMIKSSLLPNFAPGSTFLNRLAFRSTPSFRRQRPHVTAAHNRHIMVSPSSGIQLELYDQAKAMACFDRLVSGSDTSGKRLHFLFIGDSRGRQQFQHFLHLVPDYDRDPVDIDRHVDYEFKSGLLNNMTVTYRWRPLLDDSFFQEFNVSSDTGSPRQQPNFTFISVGIHHLLEKNATGHRIFREQLERLSPLLDRSIGADNTSRIVWLNQYPTVDMSGEQFQERQTYINANNVHHYNLIARNVLQHERSKVDIWNTAYPIAEEYVRSCQYVHLPRRTVYPIFGEFNCRDFVHTGSSALLQANQLLYNYVCQ